MPMIRAEARASDYDRKWLIHLLTMPTFDLCLIHASLNQAHLAKGCPFIVYTAMVCTGPTLTKDRPFAD